MQFLNTLSTTQQTTRTEYSPASASGTLALTTNANRFRNNIKIETPSINLSIPAIYGCDADDDNIFNEDSDGENIACNFLSYMDVAAYLDWAGMRPMTELEYERLCRGTEPTMLYQLAWGNNTANGNLVLAAANYSNEFIINPSLSFGNMNYLGSNIGGPLRNGIFASASGGRVRSGASFYGVMELSGNLTEPVAHIGNVKGRYTRLRYFGFGDGNLSGSGNANVFYFPGMSNYSSGGECINAAGTIIRGGSFLNNLADCSISARFLATGFTTRNSIGGGRGIGYFLTAY